MGRITFEEGRDYVWQPGERVLTLLAGLADRLSPDPISFIRLKGSPRSYEYKAGDPTRNMLFDNDFGFDDQQVEIYYTHQRAPAPGLSVRRKIRWQLKDGLC